ncbi:MAG: hypothetical protein IKF78_08990 [Atopobiaceae bacterium]|nr:hypothetical protein [Atopobiaceae bacterium]
MTPEEKIAEEIKAKMSPEDIERLRSCTDEREAQKMLEDARVKIPLDMLDAVFGAANLGSNPSAPARVFAGQSWCCGWPALFCQQAFC